MRQCLTSPTHGYYTSGSTARSPTTPAEAASRDPFGQQGDFITSPEISQVFGELIGVWIVAEWLAQGGDRRDKGGPRAVQIMELGPGRGTLMDDVLRVWYGRTLSRVS